jgi:hypothetical protein
VLAPVRKTRGIREKLLANCRLLLYSSCSYYSLIRALRLAAGLQGDALGAGGRR